MRKSLVQLVAGVTLVGLGVAGGWAIGASGGSSPAAGPGKVTDPGSHPPSSVATFTGQLVWYNSCAGLVDALHASGRAVVGPYGFDGSNVAYSTSGGRYPAVPQKASADAAGAPTGSGSAKAAAPLEHSTTNTQVADVDEPDLVKTDGRYLVSLDGQQLHIVDVRTAKLRATLALPHPGSELLLAGDRVVVLSGETTGGIRPMGALDGPFYGPYGTSGETTTTTATVVDITHPDAPTIVRSWKFDAGEVAARVVGGTIRLVLSSPPPTVTWVTPRDGSGAETARATKANQALVDATPLDAWLPHWSTDTSGDTHQVSICSAVATPVKPNGVGLVSVLSLDPLATDPGAGTSVFGAGDTAYAEGRHLYVSDSGTYPAIAVGGVAIPPAFSAPSGGTVESGGSSSSGSGSSGTASSVPMSPVPMPSGPDVPAIKAPTPVVHLLEFDLSDPAQARYLASGSVPGQLHDSYALSEYQDRLRVTTTTYNSTNGATNGASSTGVSVLERQGDKLVQVGHVGGLGTGEQVYAVRYLDDRGYVVTFQQVDPLHVIDLSNPKNPVLRGTLTLPGYSSLLLPLPNHQLLGIGQSVTSPSGGCPPSSGGSVPKCVGIVEPNGLQLALFDVADAAHPKLLDRRVVSQAFESATNDPHAVTIDQALGLVVVPSSSELLGVHITNGHLTITKAAFTVPTSAQANRTVIAGTRLFELTDRGVAVRTVTGLKQTGWVAF